jgi:hypothetical protein
VELREDRLRHRQRDAAPDDERLNRGLEHDGIQATARADAPQAFPEKSNGALPPAHPVSDAF